MKLKGEPPAIDLKGVVKRFGAVTAVNDSEVPATVTLTRTPAMPRSVSFSWADA